MIEEIMFSIKDVVNLSRKPEHIITLKERKELDVMLYELKDGQLYGYYDDNNKVVKLDPIQYKFLRILPTFVSQGIEKLDEVLKVYNIPYNNMLVGLNGTSSEFEKYYVRSDYTHEMWD